MNMSIAACPEIKAHLSSFYWHMQYPKKCLSSLFNWTGIYALCKGNLLWITYSQMNYDKNETFVSRPEIKIIQDTFLCIFYFRVLHVNMWNSQNYKDTKLTFFFKLGRGHNSHLKKQFQHSFPRTSCQLLWISTHSI